MHTPFSVENSNARAVTAERTTIVSIFVNIVVIAVQLAAGLLAHSQALVADAFHSLADLVSDGVVLITHRRAAALPDYDHNYGHYRYETVASLFLGVILCVVGLGMLWRAGERIAHLEQIPAVHVSALGVAVLILAVKEVLFRYMLRTARREGSALLTANAWHARSDAASSLVVALGILGNLAGYRWLDPLAAAIVGFMIGVLGGRFAWNALQDLSDRALAAEQVEQIRAVLLATPGVRGVHDLRTRKTGDRALVDVHLLVDARISVSEGHYVAESARAALRRDSGVADALVHIDPENDAIVTPPPAGLPTHDQLFQAACAAFHDPVLQVDSISAHYLDGAVDVELRLRPLPGRLLDSETLVRCRDPERRADLTRQLGVRQVRLLCRLD